MTTAITSTAAMTEYQASVAIFTQTVTALLLTHFGMALCDTEFDDADFVPVCIACGERPFESVNDYAKKFDLIRLDINPAWSPVGLVELTLADQRAAEVEHQLTPYQPQLRRARF